MTALAKHECGTRLAVGLGLATVCLFALCSGGLRWQSVPAACQPPFMRDDVVAAAVPHSVSGGAPVNAVVPKGYRQLRPMGSNAAVLVPTPGEPALASCTVRSQLQ